MKLSSHFSFLRFLLTVLAIIFAAEMAVMFILAALPIHMSPPVEAAVDGLLLVVISTPFLWLLVAKPLRDAAITEAIRFDSLFELAPEGILGVDPDGRIRLANAQAQSLFAYTHDELQGRPIELLIPERFAQSHPGLRAQYLAAPRIRRMGSRGIEIHGRRKDGSEFPAEVSLSLIKTPQESLVLSVIRDISAQKQIENTLQQANHGLQTGVALLEQRTKELLQLSEMSHLLQKCRSEEEIYPVVSRFGARLFPGDSGTLFLVSASRNAAEAVATWGKAPGPGQRVFSPQDCWALRLGHIHPAQDDDGVVDCGHVDPAENGRYACAPMSAPEGELGVLRLASDAQNGGRADETGAPERLQRRRLLTAAAEQIGLALANVRLRDKLRHESIRDPLTGLFNRRYMEEALAQELRRAQRNATQLAVIMIDIDHFKRFNDDFGHDGGDAILRALGAFLKEHLRGGDIACRYGGEEFILILSPSIAEGARRHAEKIREDAGHLTVSHANRNLGAITLSLGVAVFPDHASEAAALIKAADVALYQAKGGGRNRVVMFAEKAEPIALQRS